MNQELPVVKTGFRKGRGTKDQIAKICWIIEKGIPGEKKKSSTSALLTTLKPLTVWIKTNCRKFLRDGNTRPLYMPPEKHVCRSRNNG